MHSLDLNSKCIHGRFLAPNATESTTRTIDLFQNKWDKNDYFVWKKGSISMDECIVLHFIFGYSMSQPSVLSFSLKSGKREQRRNGTKNNKQRWHDSACNEMYKPLISRIPFCLCMYWKSWVILLIPLKLRQFYMFVYFRLLWTALYRRLKVNDKMNTKKCSL